MKILCISDSHNQHANMHLSHVDLSTIDTIVHAGDATYVGEYHVYEKLSEWLLSLKVPNIVFVPGNHDISFEKVLDEATKCFDPSIHILIDKAVTIDNINFYGSPNTPAFGEGWAFNIPRDSYELKACWDKIPVNTDVLITHGPPLGVLDDNSRKHPCGCKLLGYRIKELPQLKAHIFGHIHEGAGKLVKDNVQYVNASICTAGYKPKNPPIVIEI